jgi:protein TonB
MAEGDAPFTDRPRQPRWGTLLLVGALHLVALALLARAFAPDFTARAIERVTSLVTVTVATPPPPAPSPQPSAGAAAEEGRKATPREAAAPKAARPPTMPAPRASSTGAANESGASEQGAGTGAGGVGQGTGSGQGGGGTGGGAVTKPVKIAGTIDDARDYPVPPGGRKVRIGYSVTVAMTVGIDGRASNCRVIAPSPDPVADRLTCELAVARFRFRPATDAAGRPVPATYGWRQSWFTR